MRFWLSLIFCAALLAQSKDPKNLAQGKILVTTRASADPIFAQSVVLLVKLDHDGAFGLMINRQTAVPISRALSELHGSATHSEPVFLGGPVELDTVFAVSRSPDRPDGATEIFGDVYLVSAKPALEKILAQSSRGDSRIYLGYCGWAAQQLENEVTHGGWYIFNRSEDQVFDGDPATLWSRLIAKAEAEVARYSPR
ncbi:MAG TPA: YqgE/AlgH family protein [Bryobacteraceae bacterium]|jgi:putative transcriptional regulator|nr:YqgE/AlgH family protein [Bryobacteraceae bacterium]